MLAASAPAAQNDYVLSGTDSYVIGSYRAKVTFKGAESLEFVEQNGKRDLTASVHYSRTDATGTHARMIAMPLADESVDRSDSDPDYVSVLSQPLPVELYPDDLRTAARLHERVPFVSPSMFGAGNLTGFLEAATDPEHKDVVGLRFIARGKVTGTLHEHPGAVVTGVISLAGAAYYSSYSGHLIAIRDTISLDGSLQSGNVVTPVHIAFDRRIQSLEAAVALR